MRALEAGRTVYLTDATDGAGNVLDEKLNERVEVDIETGIAYTRALPDSSGLLRVLGGEDTGGPLEVDELSPWETPGAHFCVPLIRRYCFANEIYGGSPLFRVGDKWVSNGHWLAHVRNDSGVHDSKPGGWLVAAALRTMREPLAYLGAYYETRWPENEAESFYEVFERADGSLVLIQARYMPLLEGLVPVYLPKGAGLPFEMIGGVDGNGSLESVIAPCALRDAEGVRWS